MHFGTLLGIILNIHPYAFDANPHTLEGPLVHIAITSRGERDRANVQKGGQKRIRCWEYRLRATYTSEFA